MTFFFIFFFFFFNDTATTEIYTLSLHDALPISRLSCPRLRLSHRWTIRVPHAQLLEPRARRDRKSTRLNSSHANISYAVFCLKKKTKYREVKRRQDIAERCMRFARFTCRSTRPF